MRKLLKYLKGYEVPCTLGPLFKMLEAIFELMVPVIMARIIDLGIKQSNKSYILKMAVILVVLGLLGLASSLTAQYFAAKAALGFGTALRRDMFEHINGLAYQELDELGTSALVTRMTSDINQAQAGVNLVLRLFLRSPFIVIGAFIMACTISLRLSIIFVVAIPVMALVIYGIMLITIPLYKKVQTWLDQVSKKTRENLSGVRVVRAFSRQESEMQEFNGISGILCREQLFVGKISSLLNPFTYLVVNLAIAALIWNGGQQVDTGGLTQGDVIALVNYMTQILLALVALSNLIISFTKASASAIRINEVFATVSSMDREQEPAKLVKKKEEKPKAAIEFDGVSLCYRSSKPALNHLSFQVPAGSNVGIIGGTGSGKSSLVNLIPRFYDATEGQVLVEGVNVKEYSLQKLRQKVGVVPQKAVLFKGTIRENMQWGKADATDEEIYEALSIAQAREFVDAKEDGLDTWISQGGKNLSGGQRQRLTIARALVGKPEILILDDSASALDFATDAKLRKAIKEQTSQMTVFLVSQRSTSIRSCNPILVLEEGEIVGMGTHEELLETCEVYREIDQSQK